MYIRDILHRPQNIVALTGYVWSCSLRDTWQATFSSSEALNGSTPTPTACTPCRKQPSGESGAGLAVIFIIHVWLTIQLKLENHAAREPYVFKNTIKATLSSRYMIYTGLTVLVFLIYHLYQYTLRVGYDPAQFTTFISDGTVETFDVYKMIVTGFSNVWCSAFYILAVLMLFSHLRHGVQSIFQTVGVDSRKIRPFYNFIAIAYGAIICLGFISVPVSVLLGIIK